MSTTSVMNISLTADLRQFVEQKIKSGEYDSVQDVIDAGLTTLKQQAGGDFDAGELERLIAEGEQSITADGLVPLEHSFRGRRQRRASRPGTGE